MVTGVAVGCGVGVGRASSVDTAAATLASTVAWIACSPGPQAKARAANRATPLQTEGRLMIPPLVADDAVRDDIYEDRLLAFALG
jgi:hypothetical protein